EYPERRVRVDPEASVKEVGMPKQWESKPIDLSAAPAVEKGRSRLNKRLYECSDCGTRITEKKLVEAGGLCPKDGASMRLLGRGEKRHPLVGWLRSR
ncbi:MAG: hypothetical protein ABR575_01545, partial [Actinomycetota bacterium]